MRFDPPHPGLREQILSPPPEGPELRQENHTFYILPPSVDPQRTKPFFRERRLRAGGYEQRGEVLKPLTSYLNGAFATEFPSMNAVDRAIWGIELTSWLPRKLKANVEIVANDDREDLKDQDGNQAIASVKFCGGQWKIIILEAALTPYHHTKIDEQSVKLLHETLRYILESSTGYLALKNRALSPLASLGKTFFSWGIPIERTPEAYIASAVGGKICRSRFDRRLQATYLWPAISLETLVQTFDKNVKELKDTNRLASNEKTDIQVEAQKRLLVMAYRYVDDLTRVNPDQYGPEFVYATHFAYGCLFNRSADATTATAALLDICDKGEITKFVLSAEKDSVHLRKRAKRTDSKYSHKVEVAKECFLLSKDIVQLTTAFEQMYTQSVADIQRGTGLFLPQINANGYDYTACDAATHFILKLAKACTFDGEVVREHLPRVSVMLAASLILYARDTFASDVESASASAKCKDRINFNSLRFETLVRQQLNYLLAGDDLEPLYRALNEEMFRTLHPDRFKEIEDEIRKRFGSQAERRRFIDSILCEGREAIDAFIREEPGIPRSVTEDPSKVYSLKGSRKDSFALDRKIGARKSLEDCWDLVRFRAVWYGDYAVQLMNSFNTALADPHNRRGDKLRAAFGCVTTMPTRAEVYGGMVSFNNWKLEKPTNNSAEGETGAKTYELQTVVERYLNGPFNGIASPNHRTQQSGRRVSTPAYTAIAGHKCYLNHLSSHSKEFKDLGYHCNFGPREHVFDICEQRQPSSYLAIDEMYEQRKHLVTIRLEGRLAIEAKGGLDALKQPMRLATIQTYRRGATIEDLINDQTLGDIFKDITGPAFLTAHRIKDPTGQSIESPWYDPTPLNPNLPLDDDMEIALLQHNKPVGFRYQTATTISENKQSIHTYLATYPERTLKEARSAGIDLLKAHPLFSSPFDSEIDSVAYEFIKEYAWRQLKLNPDELLAALVLIDTDDRPLVKVEELADGLLSKLIHIEGRVKDERVVEITVDEASGPGIIKNIVKLAAHFHLHIAQSKSPPLRPDGTTVDHFEFNPTLSVDPDGTPFEDRRDRFAEALSSIRIERGVDTALARLGYEMETTDYRWLQINFSLPHSVENETLLPFYELIEEAGCSIGKQEGEDRFVLGQGSPIHSGFIKVRGKIEAEDLKNALISGLNHLGHDVEPHQIRVTFSSPPEPWTDDFTATTATGPQDSSLDHHN